MVKKCTGNIIATNKMFTLLLTEVKNVFFVSAGSQTFYKMECCFSAEIG